MTTHQQDFHRMCLTGWLIGRFEIGSWIEAGCLEGETVGYFSQFVPDGQGLGCDLRKEAVEIGQARYPHTKLEHADALLWLRTVQVKHRPLIYNDTVWVPERFFHEQMDIVRSRWPSAIVMVNGIDMPRALGQNLLPPAELQKYGRVIVPNYSMPEPYAACGVIVPDDEALPPFTHWKVLPRA